MWDNIVKLCNQLVWVNLWPNNTLAFNSETHRDAVRIYICGAIDALLLNSGGSTSDELMRILTKQMSPRCSPKWWPAQDGDLFSQRNLPEE